MGVGELAQATDANRTKTAKRNLGMWGTPFAAKIGAVAKTATILKYHQRGRVTRPSDFLRRGYGTSRMESGCLSTAIVSQLLASCQLKEGSRQGENYVTAQFLHNATTPNTVGGALHHNPWLHRKAVSCTKKKPSPMVGEGFAWEFMGSLIGCQSKAAYLVRTKN